MSSVRWRDLPDDSDEDDGGVDQSRQYEQTLMYGRYKRDLESFAKAKAEILRQEKTLGEAPSEFHNDWGPAYNRLLEAFRTLWKHSFARVGEDWVFLALLGFIMAFISFLMDFGISTCNEARIWLYRDLSKSSQIFQYLSWVSLPVCLILFSAGFVHLTAPQAVGSGIPEMKTILRGVVLKEYLTFKTLVAKIIGLTATLGTGLPLGKEGPFVHIASIVATLLSKAVTSFKGIYENESRNSEMLAAACAVGVACSFAAPIGGVLFSIEVTSVYFAVRNYWRGFFAAVCGAMMFRLLAVWFHDEHTLTVLFKTSFKKDYPFDPMELFAFALIGIACGLMGAFFVWVHRQYVLFMRRNKRMKAFLQKSRLLYPFLVTLVYSTLIFPHGFGMFVAGRLTTHHQLVDLFSNITWTKENPTVHEFDVIENWRTPWTNIFVNLLIYIAYTFCGSVVASTLPVPSGIFIPVFKMGAALGRIMGETMAIAFPSGLSYGGVNHIIIPGGYSIVGAAAFAGAVTHTISTSVIVFELTGQITHILPVMIAVLIANGISQLLQPSVYDSIIRIKKLPYLPDILTSTTGAYNMYVEDFMIRDVKYIWYGITYQQVKEILVNNKKIRSLPLVDSPDSMILLGSVPRSELITMLENHLGRERRTSIVNKWKLAADRALEAEHVEAEKQKQPKQNGSPKKNHTPDVTPALELTELPVVGIKKYIQNSIPKQESHTQPQPNEEKGEKPQEEKEHCETQNNDASKLPKVTEGILENSLKDGQRPPMTLPLKDQQQTTVDQIQEDSNPAETSPENVEPPADPGRPSGRFAVTKVEVLSKTESSVTLQVDPVEIPLSSSQILDRSPEDSLRHSLPRKSILKKTHSFIFHPTPGSPAPSPAPTPYATVHVGDTSKLRQAFESVIRKRLNSKSDLKSSFAQSPPTPPVTSSRPHISPQMLFENAKEQRRKWEEEELAKTVDFSQCHIDPAPFQLVERTSLLKVHSLFSMLGLNHAYVTAIGRLIGVVALKELRRAIEEANVGGTKPKAEEGGGAKRKTSKEDPTSPESASTSSVKSSRSTFDVGSKKRNIHFWKRKRKSTEVVL